METSSWLSFRVRILCSNYPNFPEGENPQGTIKLTFNGALPLGWMDDQEGEYWEFDYGEFPALAGVPFRLSGNVTVGRQTFTAETTGMVDAGTTGKTVTLNFVPANSQAPAIVGKTRTKISQAKASCYWACSVPVLGTNRSVSFFLVKSYSPHPAQRRFQVQGKSPQQAVKGAGSD
jgi:hypothetical protein